MDIFNLASNDTSASSTASSPPTFDQLVKRYFTFYNVREGVIGKFLGTIAVDEDAGNLPVYITTYGYMDNATLIGYSLYFYYFNAIHECKHREFSSNRPTSIKYYSHKPMIGDTVLSPYLDRAGQSMPPFILDSGTLCYPFIINDSRDVGFKLVGLDGSITFLPANCTPWEANTDTDSKDEDIFENDLKDEDDLEPDNLEPDNLEPDNLEPDDFDDDDFDDEDFDDDDFDDEDFDDEDFGDELCYGSLFKVFAKHYSIDNDGKVTLKTEDEDDEMEEDEILPRFLDSVTSTVKTPILQTGAPCIMYFGQHKIPTDSVITQPILAGDSFPVITPVSNKGERLTPFFDKAGNVILPFLTSYSEELVYPFIDSHTNEIGFKILDNNNEVFYLPETSRPFDKPSSDSVSAPSSDNDGDTPSSEAETAEDKASDTRSEIADSVESDGSKDSSETTDSVESDGSEDSSETADSMERDGSEDSSETADSVESDGSEDSSETADSAVTSKLNTVQENVSDAASEPTEKQDEFSVSAEDSILTAYFNKLNANSTAAPRSYNKATYNKSTYNKPYKKDYQNDNHNQSQSDNYNAPFVSDGFTFERILGNDHCVRLLYPNIKAGHVVVPAYTSFLSLKVVEIARKAFNNNIRLESISIPLTVTTIGDFAFAGSSLKNITIPESVESIGKGAFSYCHNLETVSIGSNIKEIHQKTFCGCARLTSVNFPSSLQSIGSEAFKDCPKLQLVEKFPTGVKTVGAQAFDSCKSITKLSFTNSALTHADRTAFSNSGISSVESDPSSYVADNLRYLFSDTPLFKEAQYDENGFCIVSGLLIDFDPCKKRSPNVITTLPYTVSAIAPKALIKWPLSSIRFYKLSCIHPDGLTVLSEKKTVKADGEIVTEIAETTLKVDFIGTCAEWRSTCKFGTHLTHVTCTDGCFTDTV